MDRVVLHSCVVQVLLFLVVVQVAVRVHAAAEEGLPLVEVFEQAAAGPVLLEANRHKGQLERHA